MLDSNQFIFGQYQPGKSLIHRLDPRTKIIVVGLIMIVVLFIVSVSLYLALIVLLLVTLMMSKLPWPVIWRGLKLVVWFILFTALFHLIFSGRDDPVKIIQWGSFTVSNKALLMAITFTSRIVIFVLATFFISLTTSPLSISEGIVALLKPLRWLKIPVYDLGMILFIALRFIPVLSDEIEAIRKAQMIRGIDFKGKLTSRIKRSAALILPVFFAALRRADDLSVAIDTRGYRSGQPRSTLYPLRLKTADYFILSVGIFSATILIAGSYFWTL